MGFIEGVYSCSRCGKKKQAKNKGEAFCCESEMELFAPVFEEDEKKQEMKYD